MLIDIHTHIFSSEKNRLTFLVGKHSLGIHPWELKMPFDEERSKREFIELKSRYHEAILAIGECGLDRKREGIADISSQLKVLGWHMDWALEIKRPLIIHCVRAYSDLLMLLKQKKYSGKILLHDFGGNGFEAQSYLQYDSYFSFGRRLFHENSSAAHVMKVIPREKIFLETDDQTQYSIEDIYNEACTVLDLTREEIEELFLSNLKQFFLDLNDVSSSDIINYLS